MLALYYSCRNSVSLSVCISVTRVLCDKTKQRTADILIPHVLKGNHSALLTPTVVGGRRLLLSEICGHSDPPPWKNADFNIFPLICNVSTVRDSEKVQL